MEEVSALGSKGIRGNCLQTDRSFYAIRMDAGRSILLCTVLLLQCLLMPALPLKSQKAAAGFPNPDVVKLSLGYRFAEASILSEMNDTDKQSGYIFGMTAERNLRNLYRLINMVFHGLTIAYLGPGIISGTLLIAGIWKVYCKSVLAISIGGHAPPFGRYAVLC